MTAPFNLIRPIDNLERYNVTRSNVNIYNNVIIANRIHSSLPSNTPCNTHHCVRLLRTPLAQLFDQHTLLTAVVGNHLSAKPVFLRLPAIDISHTIRTLSIPAPHDIGAVLEDEHNMPFDLSNQTDPLWRIVIAQVKSDQSFYLVFAFHHVIADGRSAASLTEQLIHLLNVARVSPDETSSIVPVTSTKPVPDAIEARINCSPSLRTLVYEATRAIFLPGFIKKALETRYWAGEIDSSLDFPNETQLGYLQFSKEETSQVVQAAKAHGTTVQALLYTASVFATKLVFMLRDDRIGQEENTSEALVFATPVSLRGLIPDPIAAEDMGNYTSEILHDVHVAHESSYWEMTSEYRKQVIRSKTTASGLQDLLEHFGMLKFLSTKDGGWEEFMKSKVSKDQHGRKASVKLSNLGRGWDSAVGSDGDESRAFRVMDGVFSQSSGVTASALTMNAATANGVLTIVTTWQKAAFYGRERGDLFVKEFKRILFEAIEPTRKEYLFSDAFQERCR